MKIWAILKLPIEKIAISCRNGYFVLQRQNLLDINVIYIYNIGRFSCLHELCRTDHNRRNCNEEDDPDYHAALRGAYHCGL